MDSRQGCIMHHASCIMHHASSLWLCTRLCDTCPAAFANPVLSDGAFFEAPACARARGTKETACEVDWTAAAPSLQCCAPGESSASAGGCPGLLLTTRGCTRRLQTGLLK